MNAPKSIDDPAFDRLATLRQAYEVMEHFIGAHLERGELTVGDLCSYLSIAPDGTSGDPAALQDFLDSATAVLGADGTPGSVT